MTGRPRLLHKNILIVIERPGSKRLGQNQRTDQSGVIQELQWASRFDWPDDNVPGPVLPDKKERRATKNLVGRARIGWRTDNSP
jgi:hypothetical protein